MSYGFRKTRKFAQASAQVGLDACEVENVVDDVDVGLVQDFEQTKREVVAFVGGLPLGVQIDRPRTALSYRPSGSPEPSRREYLPGAGSPRDPSRYRPTSRDFLPSTFATQTLAVPPHQWSHSNEHPV
jgi:hypothetical protein